MQKHWFLGSKWRSALHAKHTKCPHLKTHRTSKFPGLSSRSSEQSQHRGLLSGPTYVGALLSVGWNGSYVWGRPPRSLRMARKQRWPGVASVSDFENKVKLK